MIRAADFEQVYLCFLHDPVQVFDAKGNILHTVAMAEQKKMVRMQFGQHSVQKCRLYNLVVILTRQDACPWPCSSPCPARRRIWKQRWCRVASPRGMPPADFRSPAPGTKTIVLWKQKLLHCFTTWDATCRPPVSSYLGKNHYCTEKGAGVNMLHSLQPLLQNQFLF